MERKIVTYSLLAHINNQSPNESNYENIFLPLVKRGLAKMCSEGQFKGDDISDISKHIDELYGLNMPIPMLKKILFKIENQINTNEKTRIKFYSGGAFIIDDYVFNDYEDEINKRNEEVERLERYFREFLKAEGKQEDTTSIFNFIEENKKSIGQYINRKYATEHPNNTTEARFINFIKPIQELYKVVQSIYIGSIISTYLEYQPSEIKRNVELVLDTNFVISLIDLNTAGSTANCRRLLEIGEKLGYQFTVLEITIREIDQLLKTRVDYFDTAFLSKLVDPEDIYNACERRTLSKTDLDQIRNNIATELEKFKIAIVPNTEKYENKAKFSEEYEKLKEKRNTKFAALHDATCIEYVKSKRGKPIYHFDRVNCWFVNNSSSRSFQYSQGLQPNTIKGEDLLNLLWLTSPMVKSQLSNKDFSDIGLSRLVSTTLDDSLPSAFTIRRLDENIQKYGKGHISDEDIVRVSKGIAERTISNLDNLNTLAENDNKKFVETLQNIANSQKRKEEEFVALFNNLVNDITEKAKKLTEKTSEIDKERERTIETIEKERSKYEDAVITNSDLLTQIKNKELENTILKNQINKPIREKFIWKRIFWWRLRAFTLVLIGPAIVFICLTYIYYQNNGNIELSTEFIQKQSNNVFVSAIIAFAGIIYTGVFVKIYSDKFNQSAINAFKSTIEIPEHIRHVEER